MPPSQSPPLTLLWRFCPSQSAGTDVLLSTKLRLFGFPRFSPGVLCCSWTPSRMSHYISSSCLLRLFWTVTVSQTCFVCVDLDRSAVLCDVLQSGFVCGFSPGQAGAVGSGREDHRAAAPFPSHPAAVPIADDASPVPWLASVDQVPPFEVLAFFP